MGKFANPVEGGGPLQHQVKLPWNGENGFAAMGHEVPSFRKVLAEQHMKDMGYTTWEHSEKRYSIISKMSACIERDNTHEALESALKEGLDVTGCYRLLAV
jgi:hypothetical protein